MEELKKYLPRVVVDHVVTDYMMPCRSVIISQFDRCMEELGSVNDVVRLYPMGGFYRYYIDTEKQISKAPYCYAILKKIRDANEKRRGCPA